MLILKSKTSSITALLSCFLAVIAASPAKATEPFENSAAAIDAGGSRSKAPSSELTSLDLQGDRIEAAFTDWASRWGVPNAALAVMRGGRLTGWVNRGTYTVSKPVPVASLSKAITAMCITKLIDDGRFRFTSRIGFLLRPYLTANPPADARVHDITVGQLLTHTSGITNDPSQGNFPPGLNFRQINAAPQLVAALAVALGTAPGTAYHYNNMNYLALGMIIDRFSGGLRYEQYCANRVLAPLGITTAKLNPPWRIMGAYGGWLISTRDYAKFLAHFNPRAALINQPIGRWPKWHLGGGAYYSLGTLHRKASIYYNFWHNGSWQWFGSPYPASFGGYFVSARNQVTYVATYAPTISNAALSDLDQVLWAAAFP